ncbi:tail fiber assembly protein [Serratia sp. JSRIV004]|uniref:tail fiber assembly protein n=1 Tax=Serratia sp. JSRIV004 TaxID=2831895 RepID=UPI001CBE24A9|nr:tail fiber assembly protein [Serratia sp. JSRIV004]
MFKMSDEAKTIKVYNFMADTKEFIGVSDCYIPAGTGLPAYCTVLEAPKAAEGCVVCFDNNEWQQREDHRGSVVYDKATKQKRVIELLGPLPDGYTSLKPQGDFVMWDGEKWVTDIEAEKAALEKQARDKKAQLTRYADSIINTLIDAIELDMATEAEKVKLTEWRKYRVLLSRIDCSLPADIFWPAIPAE